MTSRRNATRSESETGIAALAQGNSPVISGFPTRVLKIAIGSLEVWLHTVRRLEDYVDTEALLRDPDAPEPPYWAHLWPGSRALARLLATEVECRGHRVVEVGCGLGLSGIVAALRQATVVMFDRDAAGVAFARANARLNGIEAEIRQADLHEVRFDAPFDLICAADVTYDPHLQEALVGFAAGNLTRDGRLLCCESVRTFDRGLSDACARHGLHLTTREVREPDEGREVVVRLSEAVRAG